MRALSVVLVMMLCLCTGALGVQVNVGNQTFPLEAVKQLKRMVHLNDTNSQLTKKIADDLCANCILPQVFQPVCQGEGRRTVLPYLVMVPLDICEICSFAACTGCLV